MSTKKAQDNATVSTQDNATIKPVEYKDFSTLTEAYRILGQRLNRPKHETVNFDRLAKAIVEFLDIIDLSKDETLYNIAVSTVKTLTNEKEHNFLISQYSNQLPSFYGSTGKKIAKKNR